MIAAEERALCGMGNWRLHALAFAALLAVAPTIPLNAQGLDAEGAIETIVGSEVATGEKQASEEEARLVAAIERSHENAVEVRKRYRVENVEIVFMPDLAAGESAVDAKLDEKADAVNELRQSIEGSAILYHAVNSRAVLLRDVVAVEFQGDDVTIFAAGKKPD
ncbi:MAG TPA: hypothetical protein VNS02_06985 [Rhizobiaceae bacterium]|nr:hypothetical protein [Rhizobiaceae bacterium]